MSVTIMRPADQATDRHHGVGGLSAEDRLSLWDGPGTVGRLGGLGPLPGSQPRGPLQRGQLQEPGQAEQGPARGRRRGGRRDG